MSKVWIFCDYKQAEVMVSAWKGPIPSMKTWFQNGEDIHLNVAKLIGKTLQENRLELPARLQPDGRMLKLWGRKPWTELSADDPDDHDNERDLSKRTVHANTNGMGAFQFSIITGLPKRIAAMVQDIYHSIFPEIRGNYHAGIIAQLKRDRTITNPWGWPRTFYDIYGPELEREAFAWYPQSTVGILNLRTLTRCCEVFAGDVEFKLYKPSVIRHMGLDIQLEVHDALGASVENDPVLIRDTVKTMKSIGEYPLVINGETLVIPMDFKVGPSWGELKSYKF